jgi:hypothetical protein
MASDPDLTVIEDWEELDQTIWKQLALPFGDTFFSRSINEDCPRQVNLRDHPHILSSHLHDSMHTWGDYCRNRSRRFNRGDAMEDLAYMRQLGASPRVWIDHADFSGNLLHRPSCPAVWKRRDSAGYEYENHDYTLDLIEDAGVRYMWDGDVTEVVGQDRELPPEEWYDAPGRGAWKRSLMTSADRIAGRYLRRAGVRQFSYNPDANKQYRKHTFPDGRSFYVFRRYGSWSLATIDGIAELLNDSFLERICRVQGTAILYSHLGKRLASRLGVGPHITPASKAAFEKLATLHRAGEIMVSPASRLLDYLVLRDHAAIQGNRIDFRSDGIAFRRVTPADLSGLSFGVASSMPELIVTCEGSEVPYALRPHGHNVFLLEVQASPGTTPAAAAKN